MEEEEEEEEDETVVFYPSPGMGHLISMVELGKRFLQLNAPFSITILITEAPYNTGSTAPYIRTVQSTHPSIIFHHLPPISLPPNSSPPLRPTHLPPPLRPQLPRPRRHPLPPRPRRPAHSCHPLAAPHARPQRRGLRRVPGNCVGAAASEWDPGQLVRLARAADDECRSRRCCVPDGRTPPVYCIGPLVAEEKGEGGKECLEWLDEQPSRSVVFLCFGSMGTFSAAQLREIAVGLERSGQRFLWVVRSPPTEDESRRFERPPEPDLDALLPEGFLERTEGRGMVVKQWAPQAAVLGRPAVGGFVTHCGWNSVLEAICAGVPMVAWPLYAEQRINKEVLVVELELAMALEGAEKGWVGAEEVERKVRGLMESVEGESMRKRTAAMKEKALAAISDGGSSHSNMAHLVQLWKKRS